MEPQRFNWMYPLKTGIGTVLVPYTEAMDLPAPAQFFPEWQPDLHDPEMAASAERDPNEAFKVYFIPAGANQPCSLGIAAIRKAPGGPLVFRCQTPEIGYGTYLLTVHYGAVQIHAETLRFQPTSDTG